MKSSGQRIKKSYYNYYQTTQVRQNKKQIEYNQKANRSYEN